MPAIGGGARPGGTAAGRDGCSADSLEAGRDQKVFIVAAISVWGELQDLLVFTADSRVVVSLR